MDELEESVETVSCGFFEGDEVDGGCGHPNGGSVKSDFEIGFGVDDGVLWGFGSGCVADHSHSYDQTHRCDTCFFHFTLPFFFLFLYCVFFALVSMIPLTTLLA